MIAFLESRHALAGLEHDADAFVTEDTPGRTACDVAF
jgi:hypothetical protein